MIQPRAFSRRIGAGFAATLLIAALVAVVAIRALSSVIEVSDEAAFAHAQDLVSAKDLRARAQQMEAIARGFILTRDRLFLEDFKNARNAFDGAFSALQGRTHDPQESGILDELARIHSAHHSMLDQVMLLRKKKRPLKGVTRYFNLQVMPAYDRFDHQLDRFVAYKENKLREARFAAAQAGSRAFREILLIAGVALFLAVGLGFVLIRTLTGFYRRTLEAITEREELIAVVSHDLRNPLQAISLSSGTLLRHGDRLSQNPESSRNLLEVIRNSAERMRKLIQDVLDHSKMSGGRFQVDPHPSPVRRILEAAREMLLPLAEQAGIELKIEGMDLDSLVLCDEERIAQVISNLVGNALRFTPRGGRISVEATQASERFVEFEIADTGSGIPAANLPQIFERYWQASSGGKGAGLGLAIVKGIVTAHGGTISVESVEGQGTVFRFTLPAAPAEGVTPGLTAAIDISSSPECKTAPTLNASS